MSGSDGRDETSGAVAWQATAAALGLSGDGETTDTGVLGVLRAVAGRLAAGDYRPMTNRALLQTLAVFEDVARTLTGVGHELIAQMERQGAGAELSGTRLPDLLVDSLRITGADARGRIADAHDLAPRPGLGGPPLPPELPRTAAAQRSGAIGTAHVRVIRRFFGELPPDIDAPTRDMAETQLVELACQARPEHVARAADRLLAYLNPDGTDVQERARRRKVFFHIDSPGRDGLSAGRFCVDPELRSYLEAITAALGQPGRCDPDDPRAGRTADVDPAAADTPAPHGGPGRGDGRAGTGGAASDGPGPGAGADDDPEYRDLRTPGQRDHDALKAALRAALSSGRLGEHRGLPVTVVLTASLTDFTAVCGFGTTGGGTMVDMPTVVRMSAHAHLCLAVLDDRGRHLYYGRGRRVAQPDQRLVLYAGDRGCTFPGCTAPAVHTEAHHLDEWARGGATDIDNLALACGEHHGLVGVGDHRWATTRAGPDSPTPGRVLWHPPAAIDPHRRGRINRYHRPGELLGGVGPRPQPTLAHQQRRGRHGARARAGPGPPE